MKAKSFIHLIIYLGLIFGFASTSFAASQEDNQSNKSAQQNNYVGSAETALRRTEDLLNRSRVTHLLVTSKNPADKAHYKEAMDIYKNARKAYEAGNGEKAKQLAIDVIQHIARSVHQYYDRKAKQDS